jgi:hypothetical protein
MPSHLILTDDEKINWEAKLEVFISMKVIAIVFFVVVWCRDVVGYQSFGGQCCLHLQDEDADCDVNKEGSCWPPSCTCFCAY